MPMGAARGRRGLWGPSHTISASFPHFYCSTRASACSRVRDTQNSPSEEFFKKFLSGPITLSASFPPSPPSAPGWLRPLEAAEFPPRLSGTPIAGETVRSRWPKWGGGVCRGHGLARFGAGSLP